MMPIFVLGMLGLPFALVDGEEWTYFGHYMWYHLGKEFSLRPDFLLRPGSSFYNYFNKASFKKLCSSYMYTCFCNSSCAYFFGKNRGDLLYWLVDWFLYIVKSEVTQKDLFKYILKKLALYSFSLFIYKVKWAIYSMSAAPIRAGIWQFIGWLTSTAVPYVCGRVLVWLRRYQRVQVDLFNQVTINYKKLCQLTINFKKLEIKHMKSLINVKG